jgi:hypothetical protein
MSFFPIEVLLTCDGVSRLWRQVVLTLCHHYLKVDESYRCLSYRCNLSVIPPLAVDPSTTTVTTGLNGKALLSRLHLLRTKSLIQEAFPVADHQSSLPGGFLLFGEGFADSTGHCALLRDNPHRLTGHIQTLAEYYPDDLLTAVASIYDINRRELFAFGGFDDVSNQTFRRSMRMSVDSLFAYNRDTDAPIPHWKCTSLLAPVQTCFSSVAFAPTGELLLVSGGESPYRGARVYKHCFLFNPDTESWRVNVVPDLLSARCGQFSLSLYDQNKVVVGGGYGGGMTYYDSAEMLDFGSQRWIALPSMKYRRSCPAAVVGPYGAVYVAGGSENGEIGQRSLERFDPREGKWAELPGMFMPRGYTHGAVGASMRFYVMGGQHAAKLQGCLETFDFRQNKWSIVPGSGACAKRNPELRKIADFPNDELQVDADPICHSFIPRDESGLYVSIFDDPMFAGSELVRAGHQCQYLW